MKESITHPANYHLFIVYSSKRLFKELCKKLRLFWYLNKIIYFYAEMQSINAFQFRIDYFDDAKQVISSICFLVNFNRLDLKIISFLTKYWLKLKITLLQSKNVKIVYCLTTKRSRFAILDTFSICQTYNYSIQWICNV